MAANTSRKLHDGLQSCRNSHTVPGLSGLGRRRACIRRRWPTIRDTSASAAASSTLSQAFPHEHNHGFNYGQMRPRHQPGADNNSNGWRWHEPVLDASLSSADRVVLALTGVAANLADKEAAERTAATHGLSLVTNSAVCVAPLLPPFGSTVDDDGEEGDGMAMAPPRDQLGAAPLSALTHAAKAGTSVFAAAHAAAAGKPPSATDTTTAAGPRFTLAAIAGLRRGPVSTASAQQPTPALPYGGPGGLEDLVHLVAEGGGGSDDEDDVDLDAGGSGAGAPAVGAGRTGTSPLVGKGGSQGFMGAATAALNRVARAASSAAELQAPVGRVAADAATAAAAAAHAAQAAVARAAKATTQMMPHYGDPSSTWVVADDARGGVRYIVIGAGADLRRRTARELTSDLVTFESYNLGAKVNKRLYQEATALYARFMPLVMDFLEAVPDGNICFGGQGVGGSLAVLLQLMCCHRGLRFAKLLPAVAVDSPPALGQVPLNHRRMWGSGGREPQQDQLEDVLEDLMSRTVLEELGLPQDAVRNLLLAPQPPQPQPHLTAPSHAQPSAAFHLALPLPHQRHQSHDAKEALVVMGEAAAGAGGGGASNRVADPSSAQVFRLMGKVVQVHTQGSANSRSPAAAGAAGTGAGADAAGPMAHGAGGVDSGESSFTSYDVMEEADGGSGEVAAVAGGATAAGLHGLGGGRRLDVAMVGSIASAAATAAASAAAERFRLVGRTTKPSAAVAAAPSAVGAKPAGAGSSAGAAAVHAVATRGPAVVTLDRRVPTAKVAAAAAAMVALGAPGSAAYGDMYGDHAETDDDTAAWGV